MPCPDEMTLELWLADALMPAERADVDRHLEACSGCRGRAAARRREANALIAALALDPDELAFLARANLSGRWQPDGRTAGWASRVAVLVALGAVVAWSVAWPVAAGILGQAWRVGLGGVVVQALLGTLWTVGSGVVALATSPLLGYSLPLVAVIGLALLVGLRLPTAGWMEGKGEAT